MTYLTIKQQIKHLSKEDYLVLRDLCHIAKNLFNQAIYNIRQFYFENKSYLSYEKNYQLLKSSENYKLQSSNMAQQILKEADGSFRSFFGLLKLSKEGRYESKSLRLPGYLEKDGYTTLVIGFIRLNGNRLIIPYSNAYRKKHKKIEITIPPLLLDKKIKEIRIIPKCHARFFEIQYTYEAKRIQRNLDQTKALAIDTGISNLMSAASSEGRTFIIDGRRLKSINQWYNKENARLLSIKDKQKLVKNLTRRQASNIQKRNNKVNDYLSKAAKKVIDYCIQHDIGNLVIGYQKDFQRKSAMGKKNNQSFVTIPYGKLIDKLRYLCEHNSIQCIIQEESYTSKASFFDRDEIPVYDKNSTKEHTFSGQRIHRGLYQQKNGKVVNADINGALNILRKSNVVSLKGLYSRGEVDTPERIRIA